jgi:hypothetical protein
MEQEEKFLIGTFFREEKPFFKTVPATLCSLKSGVGQRLQVFCNL